MTTAQKTIAEYKAGRKSMAYLAYKNDPNSLPKSFEEFCKGMDRILKLNNSGNW